MPSLFSQLWEAISKRDDFQRKFLACNAADLSDACRFHAEAYINYAIGEGESIDSLAEHYLRFVAMTCEEQLYFFREGKYRHSTLKEVEESVYGLPEYMRMYMYGLAISNFLWPQHRLLADFFGTYLDTVNGGEYLEIGPGHGWFFLQALSRGVFQRCLGVDISQSSIDMTKTMVEASAFSRKNEFSLEYSDFLTCEFDRCFDTIVMGEVLEHAEQPEMFLDRIAHILKPTGTSFITTCINSPAIDHISLFSSVDDIESMFAASGLSIRDRVYIPYTGKTVEQCQSKKMPINVGYILKVSGKNML